MAVEPNEVSAIQRVLVPPLWSIHRRVARMEQCHLACEAETIECSASVLRTFRGRVTQLQLSLATGGVLLFGKAPGYDLFASAERILEAKEFSVSGGMLVCSQKAVWRKHPSFLGGDGERIADLARTSWEGALKFTEEIRTGNGAMVRVGLRPPQVGALHAVAAHWSVSTKPALVVMPTGTGKTEVMMACLAMRRPRRLLVLVPSDAVRLQTFVKFAGFGVLQKVGALAPSVIRPVVGRIGSTPSEEDVAAIDSCNVVVSTVAALQGLSQAQLREFIAKFDAVFFDEAHHMPALSWERVYENLESHAILQFTATPFRLDGNRIPGRIIYNFPLRVAQSQGYFRRIRFREVFELDRGVGDARIAEVAVDQLRADMRLGLNHVLLARAETMERAEELFRDIYARNHADLSPTILHAKVKARRDRLEAVKAGKHRIVVCVDMFGEGFDLPALKIAALHDPHKSLAVTLQFVGRFTRDAADIGDATVVANVADPRVSDAIEELYAEDSDWNELIPELSARAVQSQVDFSDFLDRMERSTKGDEDLFDLNVLRPKTSTVIFKSRAFNPRKFRKAVKKGCHVERVWQSKDKDILIFITRSRVPIEWATIKEATDEIWDLFVLAYDAQRQLLFIHSSQKATLHQDLAKAVGGDDVQLLSGEKMFRAFHGVSRLLFHNVGLYSRGMKLRFRMYTGLDVGEAINPVVQTGAVKSNLFAVGYDNGQRVSVGSSHKGRVWSMNSSSIPDWIDWCRRVADKVLDDNIPTNEFLKHTLIPKEISQLPVGSLLCASFPAEWYSSEMESASLIVSNGPQSIHSLGIDSCSVLSASSAELNLQFEGLAPSAFRLEWGPREGQYSVVQSSGTAIQLRTSAGLVPLDEYLRENPPALLFVDGSEVHGGRLFEVNQPLPYTFDPARITPFDWSGIDITKESKWKNGTRRDNSVQAKMISFLLRQNNHFVFDDDDAGEVADVVEITEQPKEVVFRFHHCKYSGGTQPGGRVKDLYEVCGQAVRSVRWIVDPQHLVDHLLSRERPPLLNGRLSRFEKGDLRSLARLKRRLRKMRIRYEVVIVQPGLSKAGLDAGQATILGSASAFLQEITGSPLNVIASA